MNRRQFITQTGQTALATSLLGSLLYPAGAARAAEAAKQAGVKKLFLTHFSANLYETKEKRESAQTAARKIFPATFAAEDEKRFEI